jgi:hypothetical protein
MRRRRNSGIRRLMNAVRSDDVVWQQLVFARPGKGQPEVAGVGAVENPEAVDPGSHLEVRVGRQVGQDHVPFVAHLLVPRLWRVEEVPALIKHLVLDEQGYVRLAQLEFQGLPELPFVLVLDEEEAGQSRVGLAGGGPVGVRVVPVGASPVLDRVGVAIGDAGANR